MRNATIRNLARRAGVSVAAAVFAPNDAMVVGAMSAFREHGMRVPDDVSVVASGTFGARATELLLGRADAGRPPPGAARRELLPRSR